MGESYWLCCILSQMDVFITVKLIRLDSQRTDESCNVVFERAWAGNRGSAAY